jgi:hypothetical protein
MPLQNFLWQSFVTDHRLDVCEFLSKCAVTLLNLGAQTPGLFERIALPLLYTFKCSAQLRDDIIEVAG